MVDQPVTRREDVPRPTARRRRVSSLSLARLADTFNTSLGILVAALARPRSLGIQADRLDPRAPNEMGSVQQEEREGALRGRMLSGASGRAMRERIESGLAAADRELARTRGRCHELEALIAMGKTFLAPFEVKTRASSGPREDVPVSPEPRTIGAR